MRPTTLRLIMLLACSLLLVANIQVLFASGSEFFRWKRYMRMVASEPKLILFYPFQTLDDQGRALKNLALGDTHDELEFGNFNPEWPAVIAQRPSWAEGRWSYESPRVGNELYFDGLPNGQGDYLYIPDSTSLDLTLQSFTIVITLQRSSSHIGCAVGKSESAEDGFELGLQQDSVYIRIGNQLITTPPINDADEWHLIAAVFTKYPNKWRVDLVVDGKVKASRELHELSWNSSVPFNLGQTGYGAKFLHGRIGEVLVFQKATTVKFLADFYENGRPNPQSPSQLYSLLIVGSVLLIGGIAAIIWIIKRDSSRKRKTPASIDPAN